MKNEEYRDYRLSYICSVYARAQDDAGLHVTGQELFDGLAAGSIYGLGLKSKRYLEATSAEEQAMAEQALPRVTVGARFTKRDGGCSVAGLEGYTGLVALEFDSNEKTEARLRNRRDVLFSFKSPRGTVTIVVKVEPLPRSLADYGRAWDAAAVTFSDLGEAHRAGRRVTYRAVLWHDDACLVNENAVAIRYTAQEEQAQGQEHGQEHEQEEHGQEQDTKQAGVSWYNGVRDKKGRATTFDRAVHAVKSDRGGLREITKKLRSMLGRGDKEGYAKTKTALPAVTFSGLFTKRKAENLLQHTGWVTLDFDNVVDVEALKKAVSAHASVGLCFTSPSGAGLKAVVKVGPAPNTAEEHSHAFATVARVFSDYADVDMSGSDVSRLCFLCYDAAAYVNSDAEALTWAACEAEAEIFKQREKTRAVEQEALERRAIARAKDAVTGELKKRGYKFDWVNPLEAFIDGCDVLRELEKSGDVSFVTGLTWHWNKSKTAGRSFEVTEDGSVFKIFSETMGGESPAGNAPVTAHRFLAFYRHGLDMTLEGDREELRQKLFHDGWGSDPALWQEHRAKVRAAAVAEGLEEPYRKPVKLLQQESDRVLASLDSVLPFLGQVAESDARVFGIRLGTGTGKTEYVIKNFDSLVGVLPTWELAKEAAVRSNGMVWRSPSKPCENPDGEHGPLMCIQADVFEGYRAKGGNAYSIICGQCPAMETCDREGYRAQFKKAKKHGQVWISFSDMYVNPRFRFFAKGLAEARDLVVHDDVALGDLYGVCTLSKKRLESILKAWGDRPESNFAKRMLELIAIYSDDEEQLYRAVKRYVTELLGNKLEYSRALRSLIRVRTRDGAMKIDTAVQEGHYTIENVPQVSAHDWHELMQLKVFFDTYVTAENAPLGWNKLTESIEWVLKPSLLDVAARVGFMGATLPRWGFDRALSDIEDKAFFDGGETAWHDDARCYQLRTNRNGRATVLNLIPKEGGGYEYDGMSTAGEEYFNHVKKIIKHNTGVRHAVISYKAVIEEKGAELEALGVTAMANYGGLVGLDSKFKDCDVLHVLFCPFVNPASIEWQARVFWGEDEKKLVFDRDEITGVYSDERVNRIFENMVTAELEQAVGRARLVRSAKTVILYSSLEIPSVSHRDSTRLIDDTDFGKAGWDLSKLDDVTLAREGLEQAELDAVKNEAVKETMSKTGVKKSKAYAVTKEARGHKKQQRDDWILELYNSGESHKAIATAVGVSTKTVQRVLAKAKF